CDLVETLFPEKSTATSENPNETLERTKRIVGDFFENAALDLRAGARTIGMRAPEADGVVLLRPVAGRGVGCAFNDRSENKRPFSEPIPSPL
ncbi:MAG: hypothetical protein ING19_19210, partial [Azospirillum sp.]|nr:hypothetical protein [Azospirillum sp.]